MPTETTTCSYYNPLHWDAAHVLAPLDSTDPNGTAFQFASSTCSTEKNFTPGDIFMGIELFLIFSVLSMIAYHLFFRRIKIKNQ